MFGIVWFAIAVRLVKAVVLVALGHPLLRLASLRFPSQGG